MPETAEFNAESILRDTFNDDDKSLAELMEDSVQSGNITDPDALLLVEDIEIDPTVDGLSLIHTMEQETGLKISAHRLVRHVLGDERAEQAISNAPNLVVAHALREFLDSDGNMADGDQHTIESLFKQAKVTRGDLKRGMVSLVKEMTTQEEE
jgi:hypothetical protein